METDMGHVIAKNLPRAAHQFAIEKDMLSVMLSQKTQKVAVAGCFELCELVHNCVLPTRRIMNNTLMWHWSTDEGSAHERARDKGWGQLLLSRPPPTSVIHERRWIWCSITTSYLRSSCRGLRSAGMLRQRLP